MHSIQRCKGLAISDAHTISVPTRNHLPQSSERLTPRCHTTVLSCSSRVVNGLSQSSSISVTAGSIDCLCANEPQRPQACGVLKNKSGLEEQTTFLKTLISISAFVPPDAQAWDQGCVFFWQIPRHCRRSPAMTGWG